MEKKRILIIEDDRDICRTLELHLGFSDFEILTAFDGRQGFEKAKQSKPDLIILDLGLPHLPGEEICRELRRQEQYQNIPIIMVTAKGSDADRVIGRVIGADDYISKPFDLDVLEEKVRLLLNRSRRPPQKAYQQERKVEAQAVSMLGRVFVKGNIPEISAGRCNGCQACVKACSKIGVNALRVAHGIALVVSPQECIGCGACMLSCPRKAISLLSSPLTGFDSAQKI